MKPEQKRHALSVIGALVMIALAFGSKQPSNGTADGGDAGPLSPSAQADRAVILDYSAKMGALYTRLGTHAGGLTNKPCSDAVLVSKLEKAAFDERGTTRIPYVYGPFMKRFASNAPADYVDITNKPLGWLNEGLFSHFQRHIDTRKSYEYGDTAGLIRTNLLPRRYVVVIWPDDPARTREPVYHADSKSFDEGFFSGWLVVADVVDGSLVCHTRAIVRSSPAVAFRNGGVGLGRLFDTKPEKALEQDFEDRFKETLTRVLPGPKVSMLPTMGSFF